MVQLNKLNPINWSLHCWVLFCVWLFVTVTVNIPWLPSGGELTTENHPFSAHLKSGGEIYLRAGWPHPYLERKYQGLSATVSDNWMLDGLATNVLLALPTLFFLVFSLQFWLARLSLRMIFIAVAMAAMKIQLAVSIATGIDSPESAFRYQQFLIAVYLLPLVSGIILMTVSIYTKWRPDAG